MNYEPIGISFFDAEGKLSKLVKYFLSFYFQFTDLLFLSVFYQ